MRVDALTVKMKMKSFHGLKISNLSSVKVCVLIAGGNVMMPPSIADDPLGLTAESDYELAVSALGACVWYLKRCFIDKDLLSMKSFQVCTFFLYL